MMEPVYAEFPPQATVGQAIDALRELVKHAFITYIYIVDDDERLLGIVTMRDLLFNENDRPLRDVMLSRSVPDAARPPARTVSPRDTATGRSSPERNA